MIGIGMGADNHVQMPHPLATEEGHHHPFPHVEIFLIVGTPAAVDKEVPTGGSGHVNGVSLANVDKGYLEFLLPARRIKKN
nr:hypothetical protein [Moorella humiferrea]